VIKKPTKQKQTMNNSELMELLNEKDACSEAREWIAGQSAAEAWEKCVRSDWMFWICGRVGVERKRIVLAACACARLALKFVKEGEERPRICIEITERWVRGEATIGEVRKARDESWKAWPAAAAYDAAYAAYAAAAYAAYAAAAFAAGAAAAFAAYDAAAYAAYAAYDAAYAAAFAAGAAAAQRDCANAIRKVISFEEVLRAAQRNADKNVSARV
jgi:hypothetical protein